MSGKLASILLHLALIALTIFGLAACFARLSTLADLTTHFMLQYALASATTCLGFCLRRAPLWKPALAFVLTLIFAMPVAALLFHRHVTRSEKFEDITILQFNVNYANPNAKEIAGWINNYAVADKNVKRFAIEERPDIVVLQEVSTHLATQLAGLEQAYPYRVIAPKDGAFGVAVLSRMPVRAQARTHFPGAWNEYTELHLQTLAQGIPFALIELHAVPPAAPAFAKQRNAELTYIADIVSREEEENRILVGDLNISPYSPWFRDLQNRAGLTSAMQGRGVAGTWPSFFPAPLRIPIDHLLVSSRIEVLERRVERNLGSDHLPVVTKLRLYAPGKEPNI